MRWLIRSFISLIIFLYVIWFVFTDDPFAINEVNQEGLSSLAQMESWAFDERMKALMSREKDNGVVIVDVDEESIAELGQWPWPRGKIAEIVDVLFDHYQIEVLTFDIAFPESDRADDLRLLNEIEVLAKSSNQLTEFDFVGKRKEIDRDRVLAESFIGRKVVLGFVLDYDDSVPENTVSSRSVGFLPKNVNGGNSGELGMYELNSYVGNLEMFQQTASNAGNFHPVSVDVDGKIRNVPILLNHEGKIYESLSSATVRTMLQIDGYNFYDVGNGVEALYLGNVKIPVGEYFTATVPYRGGARTFDYISAIDVLNKKIPKERLESVVVLFGTTAAGLHDFRVTPVQENYPGVEIHANLISGMLTDTMLTKPNELKQDLLQVFVLLIIAILMTIYMPKLSVIQGFLVTVILGAAVIFINLFAWKNHNYIYQIMPSMVLLIGLYISHLLYGAFIESRRKQQLSKLFGQYVSPKLVEYMEEDLSSYSMDPKDQELTVMFADIQGFTKLSEDLGVEQVTKVLNEFLTMMTEVIQGRRGTIDKYMGDAIMAFWGAPVDDPEHAQHALDTAFEMLEKMKELNARLVEQGLPKFLIRIGLNTGNMSVGDMGSRFRRAYTVIGDEVNLASRIEGLTRIYGVSIIIGENTRKKLKETVCLELDRVIVKGKDNAVSIYQPIGLLSAMTEQQEQLLTQNTKAIEAYREQNWGLAELLFLDLKENYPDNMTFSVYLERINQYKLDPPPFDWDGAHRYLTK